MCRNIRILVYRIRTVNTTSDVVLRSSSIGRAFSVGADIDSFHEGEGSGEPAALDSMFFHVSCNVTTKVLYYCRST